MRLTSILKGLFESNGEEFYLGATPIRGIEIDLEEGIVVRPVNALQKPTYIDIAKSSPYSVPGSSIEILITSSEEILGISWVGTNNIEFVNGINTGIYVSINKPTAGSSVIQATIDYADGQIVRDIPLMWKVPGMSDVTIDKLAILNRIGNHLITTPFSGINNFYRTEYSITTLDDVDFQSPLYTKVVDANAEIPIEATIEDDDYLIKARHIDSTGIISMWSPSIQYKFSHFVNLLHSVDPFEDGTLISKYEFIGGSADTVGLHNGVSTDIDIIDGLFGGIAVFNGTTSKIVTDLVLPNKNFSISFFFRTNSTSINQQIFSTRNADFTGISIGIAGGSASLSISVGDGASLFTLSQGISANTRYKATVSILDDFTIELILDTETFSAPASQLVAGGELWMGNFEQHGNEPFSGVIDVVEIYSAPLSLQNALSLIDQARFGDGANVDYHEYILNQDQEWESPISASGAIVYIIGAGGGGAAWDQGSTRNDSSKASEGFAGDLIVLRDFDLIAGQTYSVQIGTAGAGAYAATSGGLIAGGQGGDAVFDGQTAVGGAGGSTTVSVSAVQTNGTLDVLGDIHKSGYSPSGATNSVLTGGDGYLGSGGGGAHNHYHTSGGSQGGDGGEAIVIIKALKQRTL